MPKWGVTAGCVVLAMVVGACSGSDDAAPATTAARVTTTTVPVRPTSTTTTIYDPATVEGQVEAAYLKSWDVYAEAVYNLELDEQAFADVYADPLLGVVLSEIGSRIDDERAALVRVDHDYSVQLTGLMTAAIIDTYQNHQVLIDPISKEPVEPDPNETITDAFTLRIVEARWVVFDQQRIQS
ncbi:MAG: hypothetical protein WD691_07530 [Acidimicrobiales bacterium]